MSSFFYMGGYAFYVWISYGLAAAILVFNLVSPLWQQRRILRRLARRQRHERSVSAS